MKILIAATLYTIGIVVFMVWILGDAESMEGIDEYLKNDDWYNTLPKNIISLLTIFCILILGLAWPYHTFCELFNDLKKKSK